MANDYSQDLANSLKIKFAELGIHHTFDHEHGAFYFNLRIEGKVKTLSCAILVRHTEYITYMTSPIAADISDVSSMNQLSELLHRINRTVSRGCFELDFDDGDIRYKIYTDCSETPLTKITLTKAILIPSFMFLTYSDAINRVIFNHVKAKDITVQRPDSFTVPMVEGFKEILRRALSEDEDDTNTHKPTNMMS